MPCVGFEPTIPASEQRAKTVHALDRTATVTGLRTIYLHKMDVGITN
jgi:hypothetical protein